MNEADNVVLRPVAEIVCTGDPGEVTTHSAGAYGYTMLEALTAWNQRNGEAAAVPNRESAYQSVWNENCGPLPRVTKLTGDRLQKLKRRIAEGLTLEDFRLAAWTCSHTEFLLRGTPKQEFHATFDWLVSTSGIIAKVLDGTYGPTGKTEAELRAEASKPRRATAAETEQLMCLISKQMKKGSKYPASIVTKVREWEERQQGVSTGKIESSV